MRRKNQPGCPCCPGAPTTIDPGDCLCDTVPVTLDMTSSDESADGGMFQSCTLQYGDVPPAYTSLSLGDFNGKCFLSTATFTDATSGDTFQYYFYCAFSGFNLTRVFTGTDGGDPFLDTVRYSWEIGASGNTCDPFLMSAGIIFSGGGTETVTIADGT